jgi:hypothetical protein
MKNFNYETFNKAFFVKMSHYSKWEKAEFDVFEAFLPDDEPISPDAKNQLPQFAFNVAEGTKENSIHFPVKFLVTEIDLPKAIRTRIEDDSELARHWEKQIRTWYRKIRRNNDVPYWMMYITPSGFGFRFVLQADKPITNEAEYIVACKQFLKTIEIYGINSEYHDHSTINKGWYFPTDKGYFDVRGDVFSPDLEETMHKETPINPKNKISNVSKSSEEIETLISLIESKEIDITAEYKDWISIGFALAHSFDEGGRKYFQRISQFHPDYNQHGCDNKYTSCLKSNGDGITLGTLYHIAKKYGLQISACEGLKKSVFWYETDRGTKIDYDAYFKVLYSYGIGRLKTENTEDIIFIKVNRERKLVRPLNKFNIWDFTIQMIEDLDIEEQTKKDVKNTFIADSKILMPKNYAAIRPIPIDFNKEDAFTMYFYFTNSYVKISKNEITTYTYDELAGYIWESQIIPRDFKIASSRDVKEKSEFYSFIQDVSSDMQHDRDHKRFLSLRTTIGYLLHTYKDPSVPKSIVFTDASLSKDTKGRTGKGIVKNGLGRMRKLAIEDGKRFNFRSQFSFSQVTLDTDILFIDDVPNRFDFEKLFSVLAEGVVVERKHKDKFHLRFEDSPKILLTTNYAIQGSGDSFEGRIYEYEFSDYYRYGYTPKDKFGHLLFDQWDQEQWSLFYNFMIGCAKTYLNRGLKESQFINLHLKKIISKTGFAFVDYLNDNIDLNKRYKKAEVFEDLCRENPSYGEWGQRTFTIHLREYYKLQKCDVLESRSGKERSFKIVRVSDDLK